MKILACSDWRIQSLAMLRGIVRKEGPENLEGKVDVYPSQNHELVLNTSEYMKKIIGDQKEFKIISSVKEIVDHLQDDEEIEKLLRKTSIYDDGQKSLVIRSDCEDSDPFFRYTKDK